MMLNMKNVADFIAYALPNGSIPLGVSKPDGTIIRSTDHSYNHPDFDIVTRFQKSQTADQLRQSFPMWPPDAFAISATLLEQSGAYMRMVYTGERVDMKPSQGIWPTDGGCIHEEAYQTLGIDERSIKICRVIGALWSQGALFISGLSKLDGDEIVPVTEDNIVEMSELRVGYAMKLLDYRYGQELKTHEISSLRKEVIEEFFDNNVTMIKGVYSSIRLAYNCYSKLHELILKKINKNLINSLKIEEFMNHSRVKDYNNNDAHCILIAWAINYIQQLWDVLKASQRPIILPLKSDPVAEDWCWWRAATRLAIIADEAGKGIGFSHSKSFLENSDSPVKLPVDSEIFLSSDIIGLDCPELWRWFLRNTGMEAQSESPRTIARCFNDDISAVLPKSRVPNYGCTIRSISHNLSILPARGRIRARWAQQAGLLDHRTFNILLVPYPYNIMSEDVMPAEEDIKMSAEDRNWGRFSIEPGWLSRDGRKPEDFWRFLESLINDQPPDIINAVILPEASLDWATFSLVQKKIESDFKFIDLIIVGTTEHENPLTKEIKKGNFVNTYMRIRGAEKWGVLNTRSKHHRWSLDKRQLNTYALSNRLAPDKTWWENIPIPPREMLFAEFSAGSILTSLICEDLARIEPCQVALRSVGPNLTVVLLMDAAQITSRWPNQYASVLADDPGTSVLTLTSFGLIKRANFSENYAGREIALWREPHAGAARSITLPSKYHAQLLSLRREFVHEFTIDGRGDNGDAAIAWRLAGLVPIRAKVAPPGGGPED